MTVYLLIVNMMDNQGGVFPQYWVSSSQEAAIDKLAAWVDEQDAAMLTDEELAERSESSSDRISAYFAASEDTYSLDETEVI